MIKHYLRRRLIAARLFYSQEPIEYYSSTSANFGVRGIADLAATSVGDYALFAGGRCYKNLTYTYPSRAVAYDSALTMVTVTKLSESRWDLAAATAGDRAYFFGGNNSEGAYSKTVDAYDSALTQSTRTSLTYSAAYLSAATVGDYAIVGGGLYSGLSENTKMDAYSSSGTKKKLDDLSEGKMDMAAATVGDYALFVGGSESGSTTIGGADRAKIYALDYYSSNLTHNYMAASNMAGFSSLLRHTRMAAATVGDYALFVGGENLVSASSAPTIMKTAFACNSSLTFITAPDTGVGGTGIAATSFGDYALFGSWGVVEVYDSSLTRCTPVESDMIVERDGSSAATTGNYAIFVGGMASNESSDAVDIYIKN